MTSRLGWAWDDNAPTALWEMWDEFGIGQSEMIGYWVNGCPVKAEHPECACHSVPQTGSLDDSSSKLG